MKIKLLLCSIVFVFGFSSNLVAQDRGEIPAYTHYGIEKPSSIDLFVTEYQKAWQELDAELFSTLHSQDTEWTNAFARIFRGRDTLHRFVKARLFPMFAQMRGNNSTLVLEKISSRSLSDSVAVLHLYTDLVSSSEEETRRVHFHLVLNKNQGQWQIVHTAIMDPRS